MHLSGGLRINKENNDVSFTPDHIRRSDYRVMSSADKTPEVALQAVTVKTCWPITALEKKLKKQFSWKTLIVWTTSTQSQLATRITSTPPLPPAPNSNK